MKGGPPSDVSQLSEERHAQASHPLEAQTSEFWPPLVEV